MRTRFLSRLLFASLALASLAQVNTSTATPAAVPERNDYRVIGYVMDGETLPRISAEKLDVINFAFALVHPDNTIYLPGRSATRSLAALTGLRKANPR